MADFTIKEQELLKPVIELKNTVGILITDKVIITLGVKNGFKESEIKNLLPKIKDYLLDVNDRLKYNLNKTFEVLNLDGKWQTYTRKSKPNITYYANTKHGILIRTNDNTTVVKIGTMISKNLWLRDNKYINVKDWEEYLHE